jgi:hypothetical protein
MTETKTEFPAEFGNVVFDMREKQPRPEKPAVEEKPIPAVTEVNWEAKADAIATSIKVTIGLSGHEQERLQHLAEDHKVSTDAMIEKIVRQSLAERIGKPIITGPSFAANKAKITGPSKDWGGRL